MLRRSEYGHVLFTITLISEDVFSAFLPLDVSPQTNLFFFLKTVCIPKEAGFSHNVHNIVYPAGVNRTFVFSSNTKKKV